VRAQRIALGLFPNRCRPTHNILPLLSAVLDGVQHRVCQRAARCALSGLATLLRSCAGGAGEQPIFIVGGEWSAGHGEIGDSGGAPCAGSSEYRRCETGLGASCDRCEPCPRRLDKAGGDRCAGEPNVASVPERAEFRDSSGLSAQQPRDREYCQKFGCSILRLPLRLNTGAQNAISDAADPPRSPRRFISSARRARRKNLYVLSALSELGVGEWTIRSQRKGATFCCQCRLLREWSADFGPH
jgi:hypothetical protein